MKKRIIAIFTCFALILSTAVPVSGATPVVLGELDPGDDLATEIKGEIHYSKNIIDDEDGNLGIQLDVFTEGAAKPLELVMIVDQSASMYQIASDGFAQYNATTNPDGWMDINKFKELYPENVDNLETAYEKAEIPGYYVKVDKENDVRLVRWDEEKKKWQQSTRIWKDQGDNGYGSGLISAPFGNTENLQWVDFTTGNSPRIWKTLMGATIDSFNVLLDQVEGLPNAKIAVVGFSSSASEMGQSDIKGGTGIFVPNADGSGVVFKTANKVDSEKDITDADIQNAFIPTNRSDLIRDAFNQINTSYSNTCTEDGFLLANKIFEKSNTLNGNPTKEDTNRVVFLFTDGCPTIASDYKNAAYAVNDTQGKCGYKTAKHKAIQAAYKTKNDYFATVYSYGPSTMKNQDKESNDIPNLSHQRFMNYLSSNYPLANVDSEGNLTGVNKQATSQYMGWLSDEKAMIEKFEEVGRVIFEASEALNSLTEIRDTVTPYFDVDGNYNDGKITIYEVPYSTDEDKFTNDVDKFTLLFNDKITEDGTVVGLDGKLKVTKISNRKYNQTIINEEGKEEVVEREGTQLRVSGFDYQSKSVNRTTHTGSKLRIIIPIRPTAAFVGGNYTDTNSPDSGIFENSTVPDNNPVDGIYFGLPEVDITVKQDNVIEANVQAKAGSTYLEEIDYNDVLSQVEVTLRGLDDKGNVINEVKLDFSKENYGLPEWVLDNSYLKVKLFDTKVDGNGNLVDADGNPLAEGADPVKDKEYTPGSKIEVRRNHAFIAEVYIWSKKDASGDVEVEIPKDLVPATGVINVTVYYPTFVFNDVSVYYGEPLYVENENWNAANLYMNANSYLKWYTNQQFEQLNNPKLSEDGKSYEELNVKQTYGDKAYGEAMGKDPNVYFLVNPIDGIRKHTVSSPSVDSDFYEKYGYVMGKERVGMNVRVYFANEEDGTFDQNKLNAAQAMRNSFFLHVTCRDENCTHEECKLAKHTSGGHPKDAETDPEHDSALIDEYWIEEFYVKPLFCEMTINKTNGIAGETYIFNVEKAKPQVNQNDIPQKDNAGNYIYTDEYEAYTSVTVTVGEDGTGSTVISELPIGKYRVTEDTEWSWRTDNGEENDVLFEVSGTREDGEACEVSEDGKWISFTLEPDAAKDSANVTFENDEDNNTWLNDFSTLVKNIFSIGRVKS